MMALFPLFHRGYRWHVFPPPDVSWPSTDEDFATCLERRYGYLKCCDSPLAARVGLVLMLNNLENPTQRWNG